MLNKDILMSEEKKDVVLCIGHSRVHIKDIAFYSSNVTLVKKELVIFLKENSTPITFLFENEYKLREIIELIDKEFEPFFLNSPSSFYVNSDVKLIYDNTKQA